MKLCTLCNVEKPLDAFYAWRRSKDGRMARCRPCHRTKLSERAGKTCDGCGGAVSHSTVKLCQPCRAKAKRGPGSPGWRGGRSYSKGYVRLSGHFDHPNAHDGLISEHTLVMTEHLGRPLLPGENVHHRNGVRDDNRIENLELWSTSQPPGQRVEDKALWALEFLKTYHPEWLSPDAQEAAC